MSRPHAARALLAAFLGASAALVAPGASAKEPSAAELALARDMLREAIAEEKAGRCADAIDILKQVIAIQETGESLMHLGECQASTGALLEALTSLERAEDLARQSKDKATQTALVPKLAAIRERIPKLTVRLPDDGAGAAVKLDGADLAADKLSRPFPVAPGAHTVEATLGGRKPFSEKVELAEKQTLEVVVALPSLAGVAEAPPPPPSDTGPNLPLATWIGGSAAIVLTAGGFIAFAAAGGAASDGEAQCATQPTCDEAAIDSVHQLDTAALMLWIGAGIGAGVAVTFYLLESSGAPAPAAEITAGRWSTVEPRRGPSARVVAGPGSLHVAGSF